MECWRSTATEQQLSILVVNLQLPVDASSATARISILGDAARAISRKLRDQDSLYVLGGACFGAVLPGADATAARSIASRVTDGLIDTAGVTKRFSFAMDIINYPQNASSADELYEAACALIPQDSPQQELAEALPQSPPALRTSRSLDSIKTQAPPKARHSTLRQAIPR